MRPDPVSLDYNGHPNAPSPSKQAPTSCPACPFRSSTPCYCPVWKTVLEGSPWSPRQHQSGLVSGTTLLHKPHGSAGIEFPSPQNLSPRLILTPRQALGRGSGAVGCCYFGQRPGHSKGSRWVPIPGPQNCRPHGLGHPVWVGPRCLTSHHPSGLTFTPAPALGVPAGWLRPSPDPLVRVSAAFLAPNKGSGAQTGATGESPDKGPRRVAVVCTAQSRWGQWLSPG